MPERSAEAVQFPDDQGVAGPQLVEDLLEGGPVGPGAAGGLGEDSEQPARYKASTWSCGC